MCGWVVIESGAGLEKVAKIVQLNVYLTFIVDG